MLVWASVVMLVGTRGRMLVTVIVGMLVPALFVTLFMVLVPAIGATDAEGEQGRSDERPGESAHRAPSSFRWTVALVA